MGLENIEVIGANGCPYVQRTVTLLIEREIPFSYKNVDLKAKPDWFLEKSPLGKVPVLRFPDGQYIFESAIINEFIDDSLPQDKRLSPPDALTRAQNKAWIEYFGTIFTEFYGAVIKTTKEEFEAALAPISKKFAQLEQQVKGPYFNGEKLSLIDIAIAPMLQRLIAVDTIAGIDVGEKNKLPKVSAWVKKIVELPSINKASSLQAEDPVLISKTHDPKAIAAHHIDAATVAAAMLVKFREQVRIRFPTAYISSIA